MAIADRVTDLVVPVLAPLDLHLYDVEMAGSTLRLTVDRDGGVNLDQLAEATRLISALFDQADPMPGKYTLEISSPGLERRLRTHDHFQSAVGEVLNVKLGPQVDGQRRIRGELTAVDDQQISVVDQDGAVHMLALADITRASTVFAWGPGPKPGQAGSKREPASKTDANPNPAEGRAVAR